MGNTIDFSEKKSSLERGASVKEIFEENLGAEDDVIVLCRACPFGDGTVPKFS